MVIVAALYVSPIAGSTEFLGAGLAFAVALLTTPAGVSGAVFLIPVQVSVLGVPSPALTPTNLLYNIVAVPGALAGYRSVDWGLVRSLALGSLPGIVAGALLRITVLDGAQTFYVVVALVLLPLGILLLSGRDRERLALRRRSITALAFVVGVIGGIYGIGGGSILAPTLVGMGFSVLSVAPAALAVTFVTSLVGIATFVAASLWSEASVAPDWSLGLALGAGGLVGGFCGARLQGRLPELAIRRLLGALSILLALRYGAIGLGL